jgi:membrane protein implicated in regulation of membrane protease activity
MLIFAVVGMVGFFFLIVSALFGGDSDQSFDGDQDHDVGHDAGPSPFSLRVISMFLTGFGATGAVAMASGLKYPASSALGLVMGALMGFAAFKLIQFFMRQQASSTVADDDMVGIVGEVSVAIPKGGVGQVGLTVKGQRRYPSARATGEAAIEEGTAVKVVHAAGNTVTVERV